MSEATSALPGAALPQANAARLLLPFAFVPVAALLVVALAAGAGVRGAELTMVALAMLTTVVALVPVAVQRVLPVDRRRLFLPFFSLVYLVYFVVPVFTEYFFGEAESEGIAVLSNIQPADIVNGQLAALVGLLALMLGFALPFGPLVTSVLPKPRIDWGHRNSLRVAFVMIPAGWLVMLVGQAGILPQRLGSGVLGAIASASYFGFALLVVIWMRYRSRPALMLAIVLMPPFMLLAFFTGGKKLVLAPLAMSAMAHIIVTGRVRMILPIGGLVALVVLYPVAQFYRDMVQMGNQLSAFEVLQNPGRAIALLSAFLSTVEPGEYLMAGLRAASRRLSALGILSVIVRETGTTVPFQGGWTIGLAAVAFVPRVLWPGKPMTSIGQWVTDNFGAGPDIRSQTGPSWIGELYFSFGWPGIVLGMIAMGIYLRVLSDFCFRRRAPVPAVLAATVILWATLPTLQAGLVAPLTGIPFHLLPVLVAHLAVRMLFGGVPVEAARPRDAGASFARAP